MKTLALLVLFCAAAAADPQPPIGSTAKLDHAIAVVERTPIWQSELDDVLAMAPNQAFDPQRKKFALDSLIDAVLIEHTADMLHLTADKPELDAAIEQVKQQNHIDDAALEKALAAQHFTRDQYRAELGKQIRAQKVYQIELAPKIAISDEEVLAAWAKQSKDKPTSEQREQTRQALWTLRMQVASQDWIAKRRAGAHIEVRP
jgi:peptidyl-prolyl cis-trans isomerase SurA